MTAPDELVARWETVYGDYARTVTWLDSEPRNPDAAEAMARAAWEVAELWRALSKQPGLLWWMVAAATTAAQALSEQANHWFDEATRLADRRHMWIDMGTSG